MIANPGYDYTTHYTCRSTGSVESAIVGCIPQSVISAVKDFSEVCRKLAAALASPQTKRPRNKSTVPTALLTPKRPTLGWIKYRPNQQASTYG